MAAAQGCTLYEQCPTQPQKETADEKASALVDAETPAPTGKWAGATGNLAGLPSACGNMSFLSASPHEDRLIAGISSQGLWSSRDGGATWVPVGNGRDTITNRTSRIVYDPVRPEQFWESGSYSGGGVYRTIDGGNAFSQLGDFSHIDQLSVDFHDPERKVLLAGTRGAPHALYRSTDGGGTWQSAGAALPATATCAFPVVVDARTYLVGCTAFDGGVTGVFRSSDAGESWTLVSKTSGASAPLETSTGTIFWLTVGGGLNRSADAGATWQAIVPNGVLHAVTPIELPDGRLAALTNEHVVVSSDAGKHWTRVSAKLPFEDSTGLTYSSQQRAFFVWHSTCDFEDSAPVPTDAVMRYDFDFKAK